MKVKKYSLFGLTIATDFNFVSKLSRGYFKPDIYFKVVQKPPIDFSLTNEVFYDSFSTNRSLKGKFCFYKLKKWDLLRFNGYSDYYINDKQIICHIHQEEYNLIEIQFLGIVLSYWLERKGIPTIHASGVNVDNNAVAFLSSNKGGKTSIAASLMQKGFHLITDDILPLDLVDENILCRPGYPTMRMWPDEAEYFLGHSDDLPVVHPEISKKRVFVGLNDFGRFDNYKSELKCIYIPKRISKKNEIEIKPVTPVKAVLELVKHSFSPYLVETMGWQPRRLEKFATIIKKVPVKQLIYPSGYRYLPKLCEAILNDIKQSQK
ncbi:hypothetical protein [Methanobacterium formicicum]|uniref:HPr kinase n=1 Tax=Methanobacterium formicicum (strain DSM 3637 / PP1) TaxID=1204725 RepID=K2QD08_METFP|nr:hypothetical protein [Methanobacterium formicicum]EKF85886.1 hypothetical protein A994_05351 [Methanobacterium formicicum DSM 3637]